MIIVTKSMQDFWVFSICLMKMAWLTMCHIVLLSEGPLVPSKATNMVLNGLLVGGSAAFVQGLFSAKE